MPTQGCSADLGRCSCGAAVRWVPTSSGPAVPLEVDPHPAGNVVPGRDERGRLVAYVLTEAAAAGSSRRRWRPHLPLCPDAVRDPPRRARPGGLPLSEVRCPGCGEPLPVVLLRIAEPTHSSCPAGPHTGRRPAEMGQPPGIVGSNGEADLVFRFDRPGGEL